MAQRAPPWTALSRALDGWFHLHRRDLPWRRVRSPYFTWLSEIMLQQTRVTTVVAYFRRFTARFPTVEDLAAAELDEVLALWSGLGYYARGRNLHRTAQLVAARGGFPDTRAELERLPGVGPYTAAAIAALAFGARAAAVDGNVARVVSRLLDVDAPVDGAGRPLIDAAAQALVDAADDPAVVTEGLIELGALVCSPRAPRCPACPFVDVCAGQSRAEELPVKRPKSPRKRLELVAVVAYNDDRVLLERRAERGLFGGLYAPPARPGVGSEVIHALDAELALEVLADEQPRAVRRTLTHRDLEILVYPRKARVTEDARWRRGDELNGLGLSAAARAVLLAAWPAASRFLGDDRSGL